MSDGAARIEPPPVPRRRGGGNAVVAAIHLAPAIACLGIVTIRLVAGPFWFPQSGYFLIVIPVLAGFAQFVALLAGVNEYRRPMLISVWTTAIYAACVIGFELATG